MKCLENSQQKEHLNFSDKITEWAIVKDTNM